jgi:TetR/AcrR family transcriptional regulator
VDPSSKRRPALWDASIRNIKRDVVLTAAREVFQEHGLEGATMRLIAARAGCTTGAVYPLFASKEAIYAELLAHSLSCLHAHVAAAHASLGRSRPHEAAAKALIAYYCAHPYEVNLGLYAFHGLKRLGVGEVLDKELNAALAATIRLLSPSSSKAKPVTPPVSAMVAFSQLIGILVLHLSGRLSLGKTTPQAVLDHFLTSQRLASNEEVSK